MLHSCGGFPCIDNPPTKKVAKTDNLGTAFAYQDDSSSDSDDEIQRQYRTAIKTANSIKRSDTFHSIKSGRSTSRVAKSKDSLVSSQDSLNKPIDSSDTEGSVKRKDTSDKAVEDVPSDAGSQQQLIFDNKAYQNEPTPSLSGSEFPEASSQDPDVCLNNRPICTFPT